MLVSLYAGLLGLGYGVLSYGVISVRRGKVRATKAEKTRPLRMPARADAARSC